MHYLIPPFLPSGTLSITPGRRAETGDHPPLSCHDFCCYGHPLAQFSQPCFGLDLSRSGEIRATYPLPSPSSRYSSEPEPSCFPADRRCASGSLSISTVFRSSAVLMRLIDMSWHKSVPGEFEHRRPHLNSLFFLHKTDVKPFEKTSTRNFYRFYQPERSFHTAASSCSTPRTS